ncbi:MAG: FixH family protein [Chitinophagales bacterium]
MFSKINWGWKIVILYSAFVVMILTLVYKSAQNKIEIVTPDYYQKELAYQSQIDKEQRTQHLKEQLQWQVSGKQIHLKFPAEVAGKNVKAEILFYRANNSNQDFKMNALADSTGSCLITSDKFEKGVYQMQIDWTAEGVSYYNKATININ